MAARATLEARRPLGATAIPNLQRGAAARASREVTCQRMSAAVPVGGMGFGPLVTVPMAAFGSVPSTEEFVTPVERTLAGLEMLFTATSWPIVNRATTGGGGGAPELMVTGKLCVTTACVGVAESVTVTAAVNDPAAVGVPEMAPVEEFSIRTPGIPVHVQVYGGVPP